ETPKTQRTPVVEPRPRRIRWGVVLLVLAAFAGLGGVYGPAVYRFATNQGQVVIETDDPDVEVILKKDGETAMIMDKKAGRTVTLKAGTYKLELGEGNSNLTLSTNQFTLERGGKEIVRVRLGPPVIAEIRRFEGHKDFVNTAALCLDGGCI